MKNVPAPHSKNFPAFKFVEEALFADLTIVVALYEPVSESDVVARLIETIRSNAFSGKSIEAFKFVGVNLDCPF